MVEALQDHDAVAYPALFGSDRLSNLSEWVALVLLLAEPPILFYITGMSTMNVELKLIASPNVLMHENLNDFAVLYDPSSGKSFAVNSVGVIIWKLLDGRRTIAEVRREVLRQCRNVPSAAEEQVDVFLQSLVERGFVGYSENLD